MLGRPPGGGGGDNPGNNLHVSSLAISIDERALEAHFAKYGEVSHASAAWRWHRGLGAVPPLTPQSFSSLRSTRSRSCLTPTRRSREGSPL